jgi:hypothetical protein
LSGYNTIYATWEGVGTDSTANPNITIRFNSDSGSNYVGAGMSLTNTSSTSLSSALGGTSLANALVVSVQGGSAGNFIGGGLILYGANTTGVKVGQFVSGSNGTDGVSRSGNFRYIGTSVISSISINCSTGSFDEGTLRVIGSTI